MKSAVKISSGGWEWGQNEDFEVVKLIQNSNNRVAKMIKNGKKAVNDFIRKSRRPIARARKSLNKHGDTVMTMNH